eukprot:359979-Chlamydomonas_euryale.AAC.2
MSSRHCPRSVSRSNSLVSSARGSALSSGDALCRHRLHTADSPMAACESRARAPGAARAIIVGFNVNGASVKCVCVDSACKWRKCERWMKAVAYGNVSAAVAAAMCVCLSWDTYCEWMRLACHCRFCSLARSVAEAGHVEQLKLRPGSGGDTTFGDFLKSPGHTKLIPWPETRAAAAERALDRQAWRDAIKHLAPLEFKKPQQIGRMTRPCARRGASGPGLVNGALCNECGLVAEDMKVIASGKASVKSKE